jgi:hypothetical protein
MFTIGLPTLKGKEQMAKRKQPAKKVTKKVTAKPSRTLSLLHNEFIENQLLVFLYYLGIRNVPKEIIDAVQVVNIMKRFR